MMQISSAWFRRLSWEHLPAEEDAWYCSVEKDLEHLRQSSQQWGVQNEITKDADPIQWFLIEIWGFPALFTESGHHSDPRGQ